MNTDTGRIYPPEEYAALRKAAGFDEGEVSTYFMSELSPADLDEFRAGVQSGKIVEVSEHVAGLVKEGKASAERKAKRKAAQAARRKNR